MPITQTTYHSMKVRDLSLQVHLGCSAEERALTQEVRVSIELRFAEAPIGVQSDDLKDTVCYAQISEALQSHIQGKEFQLIEKMAGDFYFLIQKIIKGRAESSLTVHKVNPPVIGLIGGVEYRIGNIQ